MVVGVGRQWGWSLSLSSDDGGGEVVVTSSTVVGGGTTVVWSLWLWLLPSLPLDDAGGGVVVASLTVEGWGVVIVVVSSINSGGGSKRARDLEKFLDVCMCTCL